MKAIPLVLARVSVAALCLQAACKSDECEYGSPQGTDFYCDTPPETNASGSFALKLPDGTTWSTSAEVTDAGADAGTAGRPNRVKIEQISPYESDLEIRTDDDSPRVRIRIDPAWKTIGAYRAFLFYCPKGDMHVSADTYPQKTFTCASRTGSSVAILSRPIAFRITAVEGGTKRLFTIDDTDIHLSGEQRSAEGCYPHVKCY